ncbi:MAG TPA: serine/threonine-protein kinase [Bryobacteraceae bacterium]|nr:serine/threonine-protein kinase [Bryobacteraceae bacterium]
MEAERWEEIKRLYHAALELEKSRWPAFLEQASAGDQALAREVLSLLAQSEGTASFLDAPAIEVAARSMSVECASLSLTTIGRYRINRLIGEGGMGAVYEAEQEEPRRRVAVKVIKPGLATPERLRRFRQESQALGRLQHPGIAQIYEANSADTGFGPQPYIAMEFIHGLPLQRYAESHRLSTREKLLLIAKICDAVEHAHQRGLIHRDLKPGNILVDELGQPKILDFGVARVVEDPSDPTVHTSLGQIIGTLAYMSPEQVQGDPLEVDTRSDVYSLGVILYELLSGRLPYDVSHRQLPEAVHTIREDEPESLSSISRNYRGDIETLVRKALEKDKSRRYASAADLGADIQRYLRDEPIVARPPSAGYQLQKFALRHRVAVAVASGAFLLLLAFAVVQAVQLRRTTEERDRANRERDRATRITNFMTRMFKVSDPSEARGNSVTAREILDKASTDMVAGLSKDPEVQAQMLQVIAGTYANLGLYARAEELARHALAERQRVLGPGDPKTIESMAQLGWILDRGGHPPEGEKLERSALAGQRRVLGPDNPATLETEDHLALTLQDQGRINEAEQLEREVLEVATRKLGTENVQSLQAMSNLGGILWDKGRYAESEQEYRQVIDVGRRVWGPNHPETLKAISNLALVIQSRGGLAEAEQMDRDVLALAQRVFGPEHRFTTGVMYNLAGVIGSQGRLADAEKLFRQTLAIQLRTLGADHQRTLGTKADLADMLFSEGRLHEAENLQRETLAVETRVLDPEHPGLLNLQSSLAKTLIGEGRYTEAENLARNSFESQRRKLGAYHPSTLNALQQLGTAMSHNHRYGEAAKLFREVIEKEDRNPNQGNPWTAWYSFACVAAAAGRPDDAVQYLQAAVNRGYKDADQLMADVDLKKLRGNRGFHEIIARLRQAPPAAR